MSPGHTVYSPPNGLSLSETKSHLATSSSVALTISFFSRILYLSLGLETPWLGPLGDVLDCTAAHVAIVMTQFLSRFPGVSGRIYSTGGRFHESPTAINVSDASTCLQRLPFHLYLLLRLTKTWHVSLTLFSHYDPSLPRRGNRAGPT